MAFYFYVFLCFHCCLFALFGWLTSGHRSIQYAWFNMVLCVCMIKMLFHQHIFLNDDFFLFLCTTGLWQILTKITVPPRPVTVFIGIEVTAAVMFVQRFSLCKHKKTITFIFVPSIGWSSSLLLLMMAFVDFIYIYIYSFHFKISNKCALWSSNAMHSVYVLLWYVCVRNILRFVQWWIFFFTNECFWRHFDRCQ